MTDIIRLLDEKDQEQFMKDTLNEYNAINLQNSEEYIEKYKTLKQREQMAQIETDDYQYEIMQLEKRKQILQANKQGLEYELKLLFKKLESGDM